jgi:hypothetical protein
MKKCGLVFLLVYAATIAASQTDLRQLIQRSPELPVQAVGLKAQPPHAGWQLGMVSWIAVDRTGLIYLLQRGDKADPIVVIDHEGHVVRSWGKGMYTMPHAIRIDSEGNVWTTDAATSVVYQFSPSGKKLMEIHVGGQPSPCRSIAGSFNVSAAPPTSHSRPAATCSSATAMPMRGCWSTRVTARKCGGGVQPAEAQDNFASCTRSRSMVPAWSMSPTAKTAGLRDLISTASTSASGTTSAGSSR